MSLAQRVRDFRYTRGWGPDELATRAEISRTALYQIESGKTELPRAATMQRIAHAFGIAVEVLLDHDSQMGLGLDGTEGLDQVRARHVAPMSGRAIDPEVYLKFNELLRSPLGDGMARIVDSLHNLLDNTKSASSSNSEHP